MGSEAGIAFAFSKPAMGIFSQRVHNVVDCSIGLLLILTAIAEIVTAWEARLVFGLAGAAILLSAALTQYAHKRRLPAPVIVGLHMVVDGMVGIFLMVAPWLLGYRADLGTPAAMLHVFSGAGLLALVRFTEPACGADMPSPGPTVPDHHERAA